VVEILRPAQRHFDQTAKPRVGAPMAPFLTQLLAQRQSAELTSAWGTAHYEAANALTTDGRSVCVATL
jgi:hypothetical protein